MKHKILYKALVSGLVGVMFLAGLPLNAEAASAGALDPTFSGDGKVLTDVGGNENINGVVIQPDGKIVVVGSAEAVGGNDFLVVRYQPDGSLDTTFGTDGIVTTNFGASDSAQAAALQTDGKIVVAGRTTAFDASGDFALTRYNPDGSLDTVFNGDGRVTTDFTGGNDGAYCVLIRSDGTIFAGGYANQDFAFVRYTLSGSLDTSFDGDGRATFDNGGASNAAYDMRQQPEGRIVAVGSNASDFVILRINSLGTLDAAFGNAGVVTTSLSNGLDVPYTVELQPDGKIIAAGTVEGGVNSGLARYNPDGTLDNSFDGDGRVTVNINPIVQIELLQKIRLQGDGKIVAGLRTVSGAFQGLSAVRFNANGSLDLSFGSDGSVTTAFENTTVVGGIAITGNEVVVAGSGNNIAVARFNLNIKPTQSNDFDGDGFSDYVIFRPSSGAWYIMQSLTGVVRIAGFGSNGDVPLDGDFDGDGLNDLAIYRPTTGEWWCQRSADLTVFAAQFGAAGDKPVPGDIDKDGKSDFVFWRPSNANYFALRSSNNFGTFFGFQFGANGDVPVGTAIYP